MRTNETVLNATLADWRRSSFAWGHRDCLLSVADYGRDLTGIDIGALWRASYATEANALAIVRAAGGAVPLLGVALLGAGFVAVEPHDARRGDALVIDIGEFGVGALCLGSHVVTRGVTGTSELRRGLVNIFGAWRCAG